MIELRNIKFSSVLSHKFTERFKFVDSDVVFNVIVVVNFFICFNIRFQYESEK